MRNTNSLSSVVVLVISIVFTAAACNSTNVGSESDYVDMPVNSFAILDHFDDCMRDDLKRRAIIHTDFDYCLAIGNNETDCMNQMSASSQANAQSYIACIRDLPGASEECLASFNPDDPESDADSDGISDQDEVNMGLNPCAICTYGGVPGEDCDADWDYDRDGTNNGTDDSPYCTPTMCPPAP